MAFYRSPALTLLVDYTPDDVRSLGSVIQQFIANMGSIMVFIISIVLEYLPLEANWQRSLGFMMVSLIMIICLIVLLVTIKETPTGNSFMRLKERAINIDPLEFKIVKIEPMNPQEEIAPRKNFEAFLHLFKEQEKLMLYLLTAVFL